MIEPIQPNPTRLLIVADNLSPVTFLRAQLPAQSYAVESADSGSAALACVRAHPPHLLVLDYRLPDMTGEALIAALAREGCKLPFLVIMDADHEPAALEMMKLGAQDCLVKNARLGDRLLIVVGRMVEQIALEKRLAEAERALREQGELFRSFVHQSSDGISIVDKQEQIVEWNASNERVRSEQERQQMEAALRESEALYHLVVDNLGEGAGFADAQEHFVFTNPAAEQIFGVPPGGLAGRSLLDFLTPEQAALVQAQTQRRRQSEKSAYELEIVRPDGERRTLLVTGTPRHDEAGHYLGAFGVFRDITESKQAEAALAASRANLHTLIESTDDLVASRDREGRLIEFNRSFAQILRRLFGEEARPGLRTLDYLPAPARAHWEQVLQKVATGERHREEFSWDFDGEVRHYELSLYPTWAGDEVIGSTEFTRDITERRQMEEELRASETDLKEAQQMAHVGSFHYEFASDTVRWSDEVYRIFGVDPATGNLTFPQVRAMIHPDDLAHWDSATERAIAAGHSVVTQNRIIRPDGTVRYHHVHSSVKVGSDGHPLEINGTVQDVIDLQLAQEQLRQMNERFDLATRAARLGVWDWDVAHDQLAWDDQMLCLYGITREYSPVTYQTWVTGLHPEDRARSEEETRQALRGEKEWDTEYRVVWPDGTVRHLKSTGHVARDGSGRALRMIGVEYDITERKQMEEELRESEERFRGLFDYSPIALWEEDFSAVKAGMETLRQQGVTDFESYFTSHPEAVDEGMRRIRVLDVNQATLRLYGAESKSQLLNGLGQVFGPETRPIITEELAALARGEREFESVGVNHKLTGARMDISLRWFIPSVHEQSLSRVIVSVLDITAQRRAEEVLQASEERYRLLAEISHDQIYIIDANDRVEFINRAAAQALGKQPQDVIGQARAGLFPPEVSEGQGRSLRKVFESGEPLCVESRIVGSRGEMWIDAQLVPFRHEGSRVTAVMGISRDLTERRRLELALREERDSLEQRVAARTAELQQANAELVQANQLKDEFLANMSHELRTPLTAILGLTEALQLGNYGPVPDKQTKMLQVIHQSGQHLLDLITEILDLSRIEAGKLELQLAPTAVTDVCEGSLQFIRQTAQKKNIRVTFTPDPQVRLIQVDARRLKQMLVNLLGNAVKFTPEGGQVGLEVAGDSVHREVRFTVWDTGIGIPPDKQALLFRPFVQVDGSLSRRYEGTGLGLALVRRLAELHGGRVSADSAGPDQGSRFTLVLPWRAVGTRPLSSPLARQGAQAEPIPETVTRSPDHIPVILVADDNEASRMALGDFIAALPASVVKARDGEEALAQAQAAHPDLIVMDIQMPGLNGLEAIRRLKAAPATAQTPIIALTALAMPGDRERCLAAGADDYLSKPVKLNELTQEITRLLARPKPNTSLPPE